LNRRFDKPEFDGQQLKRHRGQLVRIASKLAVKIEVVICIHAAFENLSIFGSVKKPCRDAQRADCLPSRAIGELTGYADSGGLPNLAAAGRQQKSF